MFDERSFDDELDKFIIAGEQRKAEDLLLKAYSAAKTSGSADDLEYVVFRMAHYYSMPATENVAKAEAYFLECERLDQGPSSKRQTAWFYFYVLRSPLKTIAKVNEIQSSETDRMNYYSALTLKGQSLIELERFIEAEKVIEELIFLIRTNPKGLPYGDEINLLEHAMLIPTLVPRSREILQLVIPMIRSNEYREKAKALINSGDTEQA